MLEDIVQQAAPVLGRPPQFPEINTRFHPRLLIHPHLCFDSQLTTTHVLSPQNGGPDEFVKSVEPIVRLFSDGLTNGELPDAGSWLSMIHDTYNRKHKEKALRMFKVCRRVSQHVRVGFCRDCVVIPMQSTR